MRPRGTKRYMGTSKKALKRLRDIFLEVVIAVVLVTGIVVYAATHPRDNLNWGLIALAGNTLVIFGFLISWFRAAWRRPVFWAVLAVLLLGHTAAYVLFLTRVPDFPLGYYIVLNSMELVLFTAILEKLVTTNGDRC